MIDASVRLALREDVAHQSLGEGQETVVLSLKSGYLYTCNETAERFLAALEGRRTFGEVVDLLESEYDVSREALAADLSVLAEELLAEKLIEAVGEGE